MAARSLFRAGSSQSQPASPLVLQRVCEMPTYEYKCKKCDKKFEVVHGINDSVDSCESCGGEVRRVFHPVGIVFKGSGFYATDAKKPRNLSAASQDSDTRDSSSDKDSSSGKDASSGNGDKMKDSDKSSKSGDASKGKS